MIKIMILFLGLTSFSMKAEEVCFKSLYMLDLSKKMEKHFSKGQCFDFKEHFMNSIAFGYAGNSERSNPISHCLPFKKAAKFCNQNKEVEICDAFSDLAVREKGNKTKINVEKKDLDYLNTKRIVGLVSNPKFEDNKTYELYLKNVEEEKISENCLEGAEFEIALKYTAIFRAKFLSDNGIAQNALDKMDGSFDIGSDEKWDDSFFDDLQELCESESKETGALLSEYYTSSVKSRCLGSLAKRGYSIYDKKEIYCGGETPFACNLFKRTPASVIEDVD